MHVNHPWAHSLTLKAKQNTKYTQHCLEATETTEMTKHAIVFLCIHVARSVSGRKIVIFITAFQPKSDDVSS